MSDFTHLVDLASARLGGRVLWANDEFFAPKENLLKPEKPVFLEHEYTDRGKWMDGWETRRRRTPGHDECIVQLGLPGVLRGVVVDTSFFRGNYPEHCSIEACAADGSPSADQLASDATRWVEALKKVPLQGDSLNRFLVESPYRFTHLRFHIYPDGGVARLRVHGETVPDWPGILARQGEIDLVAVEHGGRVLGASDMFFSHPLNLLMPGRGARMDDGWETKRRRGPGFDWVVLKLGIAGVIRRAEVDTAHFKGNYPDTCSVEACAVVGDPADLAALPWKEVLPRTKLEADKQHVFDSITDADPATHVRFNIFPDGGVSRLRLYGTPGREGRIAEGLRRLNALLPDEAAAALRNCCGASRWVEQMLAARPFATPDAVFAAAERTGTSLGRDDWLQAFRSHPQIGEKLVPSGFGAGKATAEQSGQAARWSEQEQAGAGAADAGTNAALADANRAYRERFGYIFIVCATGKNMGEMLALCRQRLANDPGTELRIAAEEQRKITRLRLEKLLAL